MDILKNYARRKRPSSLTWTVLNFSFTANEIANEKKVAVFSSVVGSKTYTILRSLVAPAKLSEKGFDA